MPVVVQHIIFYGYFSNALKRRAAWVILYLYYTLRGWLIYIISKASINFHLKKVGYNPSCPSLNFHFKRLASVQHHKEGSLCYAGLHVVALFPHQVVWWPAIGPWQSAIGQSANQKPQHNWRGISTTTWSPATDRDPCEHLLTSNLKGWVQYIILCWSITIINSKDVD